MHEPDEILPLLDPDPGWETFEPAPGYVEADYQVGPGRDRRVRSRWYRDTATGEMAGKVWFGPRCQGPPGHAHGGAIATVLDHVMGASLWLQGHVAVAAKLEVQYRDLAPTGLVARCITQTGPVQGRKIETRGRLEAVDDGRLIAEASALFITVDRERIGR